MITVSDEWKKLHEQPLLPETFIEIRLDVTDVDVTELVTIFGTNQASFSNTSSLVNNTVSVPEEQYALLEYNLWTLDGSKNLLENVANYQPPGFVSKNDETSVMKISLSEIRSAGTPGFTVTWSSEYGEYATDFTVEVKQGDTPIGSREVTGNTSNVSFIDLTVVDYDTVIITVNGWSVPEHRSRIDGVTFGAAIVFDKNQILSYSHEQTGDPLGSEISKNSIEFSVDNTNGRWDLLNPDNLEKYLYERQPLTVRYGMQTNNGIEWIQAGKFYLTEWRAPSNGLEATFVARDAFEFLLNGTYSRTHTDGVTNTETKVYKNIEDYLAKEEIETLATDTEIKIYERATWRSNGTVGGPTDSGWGFYRIDQGWINSDNVTVTSDQTLYSDFNTALSSSLSGTDSHWIYSNLLKSRTRPLVVPKTNTAEFIQKCVNVIAQPMYQKADGKMYFYLDWSHPESDYVISSDTAYSNPEVELTKPLKEVSVVRHYIHTTDTTTTTFAVGERGEVITLDNPYAFTSTAIDRLGKYWVDWWKHRGWVSGEFRADPRLELFDIVSVENKYGLISPVMITQIKYNYNGSFRGTYKGKILSNDLVETTSVDSEVTND